MLILIITSMPASGSLNQYCFHKLLSFFADWMTLHDSYLNIFIMRAYNQMHLILFLKHLPIYLYSQDMGHLLHCPLNSVFRVMVRLS